MSGHLLSDGVFNADDSNADELLNHVVFVAPVWLTISLEARLVTLTSRLICIALSNSLGTLSPVPFTLFL